MCQQSKKRTNANSSVYLIHETNEIKSSHTSVSLYLSLFYFCDLYQQQTH